jgi:hypothetical protein
MVFRGDLPPHGANGGCTWTCAAPCRFSGQLDTNCPHRYSLTNVGISGLRSGMNRGETMFLTNLGVIIAVAGCALILAAAGVTSLIRAMTRRPQVPQTRTTHVAALQLRLRRGNMQRVA